MSAPDQRAPDGPTLLGATPTAAGTRFEVWAPAAGRVEVGIGDPEPAAVEMAALGDPADPGWSGTWVIVLPGVGAGDRYRFRLDGGAWLADPASRWQPDGVHGASAVVDRRAFAWTDAGWIGPSSRDTVLYELHIGTFTVEGTFASAAGQLGRLADLGVTAIEIMPVAAFPGTRNWGYDGVFPSAVQESYGGPSGLAGFVDAAHAHGLAVLLDVVYNHFGPEGNVLPGFGPYLTDAYETPWGEAVNVAGSGSDMVRRFFIESAVGWIHDYHLDGLRLDAVHAIVDPTPVTFVEELTDAVHRAAERLGRATLVTIESSSNDPRIVRSVDEHGWGCDAVWDDDVHHALRVALTGERHEYYAGYDGVADLASAWEHRWVYRGQFSPVFGRRHGADADGIDHERFIIFDQNHDHVGNTPDGRRLLAAAGPGDPRLRLAAAAVLLSPFTPMLFMGEEYAETAPFPYFIDHGDPGLVEAVRQGRRAEFSGVDWSGDVADPADPDTFARAVLDPTLAEVEPHRSVLAMYRELLGLRRTHAVLTSAAATQEVRLDGSTLLVERALGDVRVVMACNFGHEPVELPRSLDGDLLFDSDDRRWGGSAAERSAATALAAHAARLVRLSP